MSSLANGPIRQVLLMHHTHTDIGYTHPQPVLWELHRRFIDQAIDLCERTADWPEPSRVRWTCEVTATLLHWLERATSSQIDRFKALVQAGQISAGAMFCHPAQLSDADQIARTLMPLAALRQSLGLPLTVAINHDINGLSWPVTQLLLDAGVKMLMMGINPHFGGFPHPRPGLFRWLGSDGRSLLTWNGEHYGIFSRLFLDHPTVNHVHSTDVMAKGLARHFHHLAGIGYRHDFAFLTVTHLRLGDNNPPYPKQAEMVRRWNDEDRPVQIRYVTPEMFLARLMEESLEATPIHRGDWTDYWSFGAGSSALETKTNRRTVRRLHGVELLRAHHDDARPDTAARSDDAWWHANLYDEHTWGTANPLTTSPEGVAEQDCHKAHYAWQARSLATTLLRDQLEKLAGNPVDADDAQGLLFFNPAPVPRQAYVRLPKLLADGSWAHFISNVHRLDILLDNAAMDKEAVWVGPIDLPAMGCRALPWRALPVAGASAGLQAGDDFIESPFHRLTFDPHTGQVTGLWDKAQACQLIDTQSPWPFFGLVRETVDHSALSPDDQRTGGRKVFYRMPTDGLAPNMVHHWNPAWPAIRQGARQLKSLHVEPGPGRLQLVIAWDAPGVTQLQQTITLFAHRPAIELTASFYKQDVTEPEAIYFAFPMDLPDWQAHYDVADLPVACDDESLPGSCRDWMTVGRWASVANARHGVTLACPDAPLVQVGGFHFAQGQQARPTGPALLLSWVMNNYWNTNYPITQPGRIDLRYELFTHGPYDAAAATRRGLEASAEVEVHPMVTCQAEASTTLLVAQGDESVLVVGIQRGQGGGGASAILRLVNVASRSAATALRWTGRPLCQASLCDTLGHVIKPLEVDDGQVHVTLPARSVRSVAVHF